MKALFKKMDKVLFFFMLLYIVYGAIMILSASSVSAVLRYDVSTYYFFIRQLIFVGVSIVIGLIILKIPTKKYKFISPFYIIGIIALLIFVWLYGVVSGGAKSWLDLGVFSIQPTEFAKSALIIFMGVFYEYSIKKNKPFAYHFIPIVITAIICFLVALQPDLGGVLIIGGIFFFTFLKVPFTKKQKFGFFKFLTIGALIGGLVIIFFGSEILSSYQISRLTNFTNPCNRYLEDSGYQVCNGYIAYHNGGLFGVGIGNSSQKYLYLPEAHTDFIFPIIVEELGLLVGIATIIGYVIILYRILKIGKNCNNIRNSLICYGTFIYLLLHLLINLMGTLALIPLTGVPLPFLSYGGSFNMNVILMVFIVERISIENKTNQEKRELEIALK